MLRGVVVSWGGEGGGGERLDGSFGVLFDGARYVAWDPAGHARVLGCCCPSVLSIWMWRSP